ncbi:ribokinase [Cohnella sp. CFH 77786]|uniref:ribokinase n=1 Tax=Cohnella sp. CFH 77786 TaxID=2662265 RepID=UPI001C610170|nr:ribokinase [Cohnella sp. CFH 77786]MBW5448036.1 ribokinase [Cohnella sp. CFH 77786]
MKIIVIGSANMDMVMKTVRMPEAGETLNGTGFFLSAGGKGANQAVACAKMGAPTWLLGKVGDDVFGQSISENLARYGVQTGCLETEPGVNTGVAAITVCAGNNRIILEGGANKTVTPAYIDRHQDEILSASAVMLQLEIPLAAVYRAIELAKGKVPVFLNPAPAVPLDESMLVGIDYFSPNELEVGMYTGIQVRGVEDAMMALNLLKAKGIRFPLITLGDKGVVYYNGTENIYKEGLRVIAVDSTAAGDTFSGTLAAMIVSGKTMDEAVDIAQRAAAISVTRPGAQDSIPVLSEVLG